jgi:hypothetical protein
MRPSLSLCTYPIDLLDHGVDVVLDDIASLGVGGVSLAATYHAGRLLLPHNPKRAVHFLEDGVAYFHVDPARYRALALAPVSSRAVTDIDLFGAAGDAAATRGLELAAWVVGTHNSRLGRMHPACTIRNVFGDRYTYGLCPANPAVRAYLPALCREVAETCRPAAIELESLGYMGYAHRSHHDKAAFPIGRTHEFLLSICACDACLASWGEQGANPHRAVTRARAALVRHFERGGSSAAGDDDGLEASLQRVLGDDLAPLVAARALIVTTLLAAVRDAVPPRVPLRLTASPSPYTTGAAAGVDLASLAPHVEAVIVDLFTSSADDLRRAARAAKTSAGSLDIVANLRAHWPDSTTGDEFVEKIAVLRAEGIRRLRCYHYGLMPRANREWIRRAAAVVTG